MSDRAVLPIYFFPDDADLAPVRTAFSAINARHGGQLRVKPIPARQGQPGGVLALAAGYDWIRDHVEPKTPAQMEVAVEWCLGLRKLEKGPVTVLDKMKKAFGDGVKEVEYED